MTRIPSCLICITALSALCMAGCGKSGDGESNAGRVPLQAAATPADRVEELPTLPTDTVQADAAGVSELVSTEEMILQLTPELKKLVAGVLNLQLPDHQSRGLFTPSVHVTDVASAPAGGSVDDVVSSWVVNGQPQSHAREQLQLWQPLLNDLLYFEHAKFSIVRGQWTDNDRDSFMSDVTFHGLARTRSRGWRAVDGTMQLGWKSAGERWTIAEWTLKQLTTSDRAERMFSEETSNLGLSAAELDSLTTSQHWLYAVRHYYPRKRAAMPSNSLSDNRFFPVSTAHHPAVSVVDVDGDGLEDLYICVRWGKNMLLHNQGRGQFAERSAEFGLDIDGRSNGAVFADFDNDGDPDVVIARGLERSRYLVNENGQFVDRSTELVEGLLPFEATSLSVADYNNDGLLDVYFSTYHTEDISQRLDADLSHPDHRIHKTLTAEQSRELRRRHREESRSYINQVGPPNILLQNVGDGRFVIAPESAQLAVWRNTFQASWSDVDNDGDPDLYVANDFAPDFFFRNDGEQGFRDVTAQAGMRAMGFAMGASWGDFDNDGRQDLYVSNMFSKAGSRITGRISSIDPRIAELAQGNYLYRQTEDGFQLVSGLKPPALTVARAGWSWGGQFADFDNDGFLDIYVSSGYFTAPSQFETDVDL
ncbi:MAG: VCBS repeat-containing protein [Planctomycetales bacterium]|nr:VCBS repeat-containing protein [Planctomycetales bacterium]